MNIRRETAATRCEICHQSDRFDPSTNNCTRCNHTGGSSPSGIPKEIVDMGALALCIAVVIGLAYGLNFLTNAIFGQNILEFILSQVYVLLCGVIGGVLVRILAQIVNNIWGSRSRLNYAPFLVITVVWLLLGNIFISFMLGPTTKAFKDVAVNGKSKTEWVSDDSDGNVFHRLNYGGKLDAIITQRNKVASGWGFRPVAVNWWVYDHGDTRTFHFYVFTLV